jgi:hypothetical protein
VEQPALDIQYADWHAVHDHMGKTLHVYGQCELPGGGFALTLEPCEKQGANPLMLMLGFRITPTAESPSHQPLEHRQNWDDDGLQYTEVGFVVIGYPATAPPSALPIEDVY